MSWYVGADLKSLLDVLDEMTPAELERAMRPTSRRQIFFDDLPRILDDPPTVYTVEFDA